MKIKKKLLIGFGLLFAVMLVFGAVSMHYIKVISETSSVTLKNNYETLTFTREMRSILDENDLPLTSQMAEAFDQALKKQENNITEPGEKEVTADLRNDFSLLIDPSSSINQKHQAERNIRSQLKKIEELNMRSIVLKNDNTHSIVSNATLYLEGIAFITFLILFVFVVNFPGFILNPLNQFTEGIQQISQKNYNKRLEFQSNDEFVELAAAFNSMATGLSEAGKVNHVKIISAEMRIKLLIEETKDAIIGISETQEIIFINATAKKVLSLGEKSVIGRSAQELMKSNEVMKAILENADIQKPLEVNIDGKVFYFKQRNLEIVVPNLKQDVSDTIELAGFSAGMIYILENVKEKA